MVSKLRNIRKFLKTNKLAKGVKNFLKRVNKNFSLVIHIKLQNIPKLAKFYFSYKRYKQLAEKEKLNPLNFYIRLDDNKKKSTFDSHYFYQGVWAFKKIKEAGVDHHVDIGSEIRWVGLLSTIIKVTFIDIRPFKTDLESLVVKKGDIKNLPFKSNSLKSLSCLHVAEHVGLGRYGDKLNPQGTEEACNELSRVLAPGGNLYFSVPVGKQKTYFNAHRVHSSKTILGYFKNLKLIELSGITDSGEFIRNIDINILERSYYACGLFKFTKRN